MFTKMSKIYLFRIAGKSTPGQQNEGCGCETGRFWIGNRGTRRSTVLVWLVLLDAVVSFLVVVVVWVVTSKVFVFVM